MKGIVAVAAAWLLFAAWEACAQEALMLEVMAGDVNGLRTAIEAVNQNGEGQITILPDANGHYPDFRFLDAYGELESALPVVTGKLSIRPAGDADIYFTPADSLQGQIRLIEVIGNGSLSIYRSVISDFGTPFSVGGAMVAWENASLQVFRSDLRNNTAALRGGAIAALGMSQVRIRGSNLQGNSAGDTGGALTIEGSSRAVVDRTRMADNEAGNYGCAIDVAASAVGDHNTLEVVSSVFSGPCESVRLHNPLGRILSGLNFYEGGAEAIRSTDTVNLFAGLFDLAGEGSSLQGASPPGHRTEALCEDFGSGAFVSLGYNISADDSCSLDQDSDLPAQDPGFTIDDDGLIFPDPGSPAVEAGAPGVLDIDGDGLMDLPCGYADVYGTGRPQDADGDGDYRCDIGPVEVAGSGDIQAGHSGVFFHPDRNGEGNYVEILDDNTAVVYTFTYNTDGSGPAWFLGVGEVTGNAIVIDELLQPVGPSFGADYDVDDLVNTPAGGMSLVFNDCRASNGLGGSVAYSGEPGLGYEGLLSRAFRLGGVTGCNFTPVPRAGLSGSWFDPARTGEGLIIQWLADGTLLAMFFTFAPDGTQYWATGSAANPPAEGPIELQVVAPSAFARWGSAYDAQDAETAPWGTFTLEWDGCGALAFRYASTLPGFGAGTRNYQRLTTLQGTSCP